jgi:hypothetical protein
VRLGATVIVAALAVWFLSFWLDVSSGLSTAMNPPVRPGEVIGSWGETLATIAFVAGWALLVIALWRRRRQGR